MGRVKKHQKVMAFWNIPTAPLHPILRLRKCVTSVSYQVNDHTNRLDNKVSGKLKRGAQNITKDSELCRITCTDGSVYVIPGCIQASLVEVNERLLNCPQLLVEKPETDGYIGILLTKIKDHDKEMSKLLTSDQYNKLHSSLHSSSETVSDSVS